MCTQSQNPDSATPRALSGTIPATPPSPILQSFLIDLNRPISTPTKPFSPPLFTLEGTPSPPGTPSPSHPIALRERDAATGVLDMAGDLQYPSDTDAAVEDHSAKSPGRSAAQLDGAALAEQGRTTGQDDSAQGDVAEQARHASENDDAQGDSAEPISRTAKNAVELERHAVENDDTQDQGAATQGDSAAQVDQAASGRNTAENNDAPQDDNVTQARHATEEDSASKVARDIRTRLRPRHGKMSAVRPRRSSQHAESPPRPLSGGGTGTSASASKARHTSWLRRVITR